MTRPAASALLAVAMVAVLAGPALADEGTSDDQSAAAAPPDRFASSDHRGDRAPARDYDRLAGKAGNGRVRVIVGLRTLFTPEGTLSGDEASNQRGEIAQATADVRGSVQGAGASVVHTYHAVPYVAMNLSAGALRKLQDSGRAASIDEDIADAPSLAQSGPLVEAPEIASLGRGGSGSTIAILDTGIDKAHTFLQQSPGVPKVVSEACYSDTANCPGGVAESTAAGSGAPCTYGADGCRHGTHVAGIAAGKGASFSGIARDATLISIQVFSRFTGTDCDGAGEDPCPRAYISDQIKALERVYDLRATYRIAAVNMSLGGAAQPGACDGDTRKTAIDNLLSVGIATVVASGNEGSSTGTSPPSCISSAVSVGSTTKADAISGFSNSSVALDLLAPGSSINSSVPGGGFALFSGTSMATPHVAGAFAILRQTDTAATVATELKALQEQGKPITDARNGITRSRIKVLAASARLKGTGFTAANSFSGPGYGATSAGTGLSFAAGRGGSGSPSTGTIDVQGIPSDATIQAAYLYWMTLGGPDTTAVLDGTSRTGTLVGAGAPTCWAFGDNGPNRNYRVVLPSGAVTGNGAHTISGIGDGTTVDPQGASLVVVYNVPSSSRTGRVYLRHGGMAGTNGKVLTTTFSTSIPSAVRGRPALLAGVGDGQGGPHGAMQFNATPVTAGDFFVGDGGNYWDDVRIPLTRSLLPVGTTSRSTSLSVGTDCVSWSFLALAYQY
jgi:subtilisin family serine protease